MITVTSWQQFIRLFFPRDGAIISPCLCEIFKMQGVVFGYKGSAQRWSVYPDEDNGSQSLTHINVFCVVIGHCYIRSQTAGVKKVPQLIGMC